MNVEDINCFDFTKPLIFLEKAKIVQDKIDNIEKDFG